MLVFVCETVTGGGYLGEDLPDSLIAEGALMRDTLIGDLEDLPDSLIAEGALMRDTLIGDLEDLPGVRVATTHDARLPAPPRGRSTALRLGDDPRSIWNLMAAEADCCWPIAPETGGILERLVTDLRARSRRVISPDAETLRICASKASTAETLAAAGVPVVPTWRAEAVPTSLAGPVVIKPDDGAGAANVRVYDRPPPRPYPPGVVVQPFVEGTAASLTLLCQEGRSHVLAANRQHVSRADGALNFSGVTVGAFPVDNDLCELGARIGAALPGLHGIVGVDYIATADGPVVVEVNPRLTTSYAGLRRSLGVNPAAFVAELIRDGAVPDLPHLPPAIPIEVLL